jgi:glutamyl-tRNA synthetase
VKLFELEKINRRNAAFDLDKCFWLNGQYVAQMSLDRFIELSRPFLERDGIDTSDEKYFRSVMSIVKEKIKLLGEVPAEWVRAKPRQSGLSGYSGYSSGEKTEGPTGISGYSGYSGVSGYSSYFFTEDYEFDPGAVEKVFGKPEAAERLIALRDELAKTANWNVQTLETTLKSLARKLRCKTGDLVHPARVAVSGRSVGPSLYHMLEVMGKERVLKRFDRLILQLGAK